MQSQDHNNHQRADHIARRRNDQDSSPLSYNMHRRFLHMAVTLKVRSFGSRSHQNALFSCASVDASQASIIRAAATRAITSCARKSSRFCKRGQSAHTPRVQVHPVRVMPSNVVQNHNILNQIPTGRAQQKRESIVKSAPKPLPGGGRPKPKRVVCCVY